MGTFTFLVSFWFQLISVYPSIHSVLPQTLEIELPRNSQIVAGNIVTIRGHNCGLVRSVAKSNEISIATIDILSGCLNNINSTPVALITFPGGESCSEAIELVSGDLKVQEATAPIKAYDSYSELWSSNRV